MKIFGNVCPERIENRLWLIILILLPMKQELETFKKSISPLFWIKLFRKVLKDLSANDNLYKGKIRGQFGKFRYILMIFFTGNIIRWSLLYMRRIRFTYSLLKVDFSNEKSQLLFNPIEHTNKIR